MLRSHFFTHIYKCSRKKCCIGFKFRAYGRLAEMKKKQNADKMKIYNVSQGAERKQVLEKGNVWTRPTMSMELKSQYHREHSKREFRKRLKEYEN